MTEIVLTYVGSVFIAMEFIRKFTDLQALMGMLIGWPLLSVVEDKKYENWSGLLRTQKLNIIFRVIGSLVLCFLTLPLTLSFYIIWVVVLVLNSFHNWVNRLYAGGKRRYHPLYGCITGILLSAYKQSADKNFSDLDEQKVIKEIERREIPILPIVGVIFISVAFVLFLV